MTLGILTDGLYDTGGSGGSAPVITVPAPKILKAKELTPVVKTIGQTPIVVGPRPQLLRAKKS
jgi:hypothetical protein